MSEDGIKRNEKIPVAPGERMCPACKAAPVTCVNLLPMAIGDLDRAVELRRHVFQANQGKRSNSKDDGVKFRFTDAPPEVSYLLLSHGGSTGKLSSVNDYQRTGRWTDEERAYADFLVEAFDSGNLPVLPGVKLGEFLGEMLLCKNSRLTKKMKHAKFSVRSYDFAHPIPTIDRAKLAILEQKFLDSIPLEHVRLELGFHLTRVWRSHLSNLCLKINSKLLDFTEWYQSLQKMEQRAIEAEDSIRQTRRERMSNMLRTDSSKTDMKRAISSSSMQMEAPLTKRSKKMDGAKPDENGSLAVASGSGASVTDTSSEEGDEADLLTDMLDQSYRPSRFEDDYTKILNDLANETSSEQGVETFPIKEFGLISPQGNDEPMKQSKSSPFLIEIAAYMESHKLSYQHADVWVPSPTMDAVSGHTTLLHAGSVTRADIDSDLFARLHNLGDCTARFSFPSGVGLPGRVWQDGRFCCQTALNETDPRFSVSSEGDKKYGIKSGFGVYISSGTIPIVVCFYSVNNVAQDAEAAATCHAHLLKLHPQPKWNPSIEMSSLRDQMTPHTPYAVGAARVAADEGSVASTSTYRSKTSNDETTTDQQIATLLGEYMPWAPLSNPDEDNENSTLLPHFMSLRLLLLRSLHRRSREEAEAIDLVRKSYAGYARCSHRNDREVAHLIVRDWQFLRSNVSPPTTTTFALAIPKREEPQSSMRGTGVKYSNGIKREASAPMVEPRPLAFIDPVAMRRGS